MAISTTTTCCLNLPPPLSNSRLTPSKTNQLGWSRNEKWSSQCMAGMAAMLIGLEMVDLIATNNTAIASESVIIGQQAPFIQKSKEKHKWSDKRMCPPWRLNSLETIVPEDLPRPSARRRWEAVGDVRDAPEVINKRKVIIVKRINGCFSM